MNGLCEHAMKETCAYIHTTPPTNIHPSIHPSAQIRAINEHDILNDSFLYLHIKNFTSNSEAMRQWRIIYMIRNKCATYALINVAYKLICIEGVVIIINSHILRQLDIIYVSFHLVYLQ